MPTIFLVEDNQADVELFKIALQDAGVDCELKVFGDGSDVIAGVSARNEHPSEHVPDLIVLDVNLPKNNAFDVLRVLRETPTYSKVAVAVLSSSVSDRELAKLADFNIRQFIAKPSDLEQYLAIGKTVGRLLEQGSAMSASV